MTRDFKAEFDQFCSENSPENLYERMDALSNQHDQIISELYGRFKSQFKVEFNLLVKATADVNYVNKKSWPSHRPAQYIACLHNLKTLYSSFDRLTRGYYSDSSILARSPYETLIKIIFISLHPQLNPNDIIVDEKIKGSPNFALTNFLKDKLKVDWGDYFLMSAASHGNKYEVLKEIISISKHGQTKPFSIKIKYNKPIFEIGLNHLTFLMFAYLKIVRQLFFSDLEGLSKDSLNTIRLIDQSIELRESSTIAGHPKPYWPQVFKDLTKILKAIEISESGADWESTYNLT